MPNIFQFWMCQQSSGRCAAEKLCTCSATLDTQFGVCSPPEIFHRKTTIFDSIEGTNVYADDVLIRGKEVEEHDQRFWANLERARGAALKPNKHKCKFHVMENIPVGELNIARHAGRAQ